MPRITFADSNITPRDVADIVARHISEGRNPNAATGIIQKHELDYLSMHQGESSVAHYRRAVALGLREVADRHFSQHGDSPVTALLYGAVAKAFPAGSVTPKKVAKTVAQYIAEGGNITETIDVIQKHAHEYLSLHNGAEARQQYRNEVALELRQLADQHTQTEDSLVNTLLYSIATVTAAKIARSSTTGWLRHSSGLLALGMGVRTAQKGSSSICAWMHAYTLHDIANEIASTTRSSQLRDALKVLQTHFTS